MSQYLIRIFSGPSKQLKHKEKYPDPIIKCSTREALKQMQSESYWLATLKTFSKSEVSETGGFFNDQDR